jgi:GNAT superfamily N-acetyltransferase
MLLAMPQSVSFVIRDATPAELPLLGKLEDRAAQRFRESVHPYAVDLPHFDAAQLAELHRAGTVWVAVDPAGTLLGFVLGGYLGEHAYVQELDVDLPYGRRGIGRALVRRVGEWAAERGHDSLLLSTFADVPWNGPFYARLGFEVVPLDEYDPVMRAQRRMDGISGLKLTSRVMMRAPVARLLAL